MYESTLQQILSIIATYETHRDADHHWACLALDEIKRTAAQALPHTPHKLRPTGDAMRDRLVSARLGVRTSPDAYPELL